MRYQRITLILIILLAVAVNAATNTAHAPHPLQHQKTMMHSGDVILPRRRQKVLGGGENGPPIQPSLRRKNCHRTWW
jgi:hypothetical protein